MQKKGAAFRFYVLLFLFAFTGSFVYLYSSCFIDQFVGLGSYCSYLSESFVIFGAWGIFTIGYYYAGWRGGVGAGTGLALIVVLLHLLFRIKLDFSLLSF